MEMRNQNECNPREGWALTREHVAMFLPEQVFKSELRRMEIRPPEAEELSWGTEKFKTFKQLSGLVRIRL